MQHIKNKLHITIITVTFNEEVNLPKFFDHLKNLQQYFEVKIIIVDQSSIDNTVDIIKNHKKVEFYIHKNKGYADPDKKWIFENCITDENERCLILDADDEVSKEFSSEIFSVLSNTHLDCYMIPIDPIFLGITSGVGIQTRLFKKSAMILTNDIHDYMHPQTNKIGKIKQKIISNDLKYLDDPFGIYIKKFDRYALLEAKQMHHKGIKKFIYVRMCCEVIESFLYYYFRQKLCLYGLKGLNNSIFFSLYTYLKYCKLIAFNKKI